MTYAISLWQPWASLVALGLKRYETRSWSTNYHGPILIHASKKWTREQKWYRDRFAEIIRDQMIHVPQDMLDRFREDLPLGALLAKSILEFVEPTSTNAYPCKWVTELSRPEHEFGDFSIGRYGWRLARPRAFDRPIPFSGKQGLFRVPDEVTEACRVSSP